MQRENDRRLFLKSAGAISAAAVCSAESVFAQEPASEPASSDDPIQIGLMGMGNRGGALIKGFMKAQGANVRYLCDVDSGVVDRASKAVAGTQATDPIAVTDYRRMLDDPKVDAIVVATPNHWHAPAGIGACNAGKHVYVEKPCSHNPREGELMVEAARANDRVVQMGTQRRSWPALRKAIQLIHDGGIGDTLYSRTWYNNRRGSIGKGKQIDPPAGFDWDTWQGPAPRQPYKDNAAPYNWHWHWAWGNGELGNNGVHGIDVARWALDVAYPKQVTALGGRYRFDDDQETPDTMMVSMDFAEGKTITWEGLSWSPLGPHDTRFGMSIHGTDGSIVIRDSGYVRFDMQGKEVAAEQGAGGDDDHLADFIDAIRTNRRPNADILEAHRSTLLCHLGNIAYRTGSVLTIDPENGHIKDNDAAQEFWQRDYESGWKPKMKA